MFCGYIRCDVPSYRLFRACALGHVVAGRFMLRVNVATTRPDRGFVPMR